MARIVCVDHSLPSHLLRDPLVCFHVSAVLGKDSGSIRVQVFVRTSVLSSLGQLPECGVAGPLGKRRSGFGRHRVLPSSVAVPV